MLWIKHILSTHMAYLMTVSFNTSPLNHSEFQEESTSFVVYNDCCAASTNDGSEN